MLNNTENQELPIFRLNPDDPDKENNLATALFRVTSDAIQSKVYVGGDKEQAFTYHLSGNGSCHDHWRLFIFSGRWDEKRSRCFRQGPFFFNSLSYAVIYIEALFSKVMKSLGNEAIMKFKQVEKMFERMEIETDG